MRLKELRKKEKLTMVELSEKLHLSQSTISLYESGKREPDVNTLKKIANFFNVSIDYLLENTNDLIYKTPKENLIRIVGIGGSVKDYQVSEAQRKAIETLLEKNCISSESINKKSTISIPVIPLRFSHII